MSPDERRLDRDRHAPTRRSLSLQASFKEGTFSKLGKVLPDGAQLHVTNVIIAGDMAVVELVSDASARNGMRFDNHYCWVTRLPPDLLRWCLS